MAIKDFKFLKTVYLGDLNIFGSAYFESFFVWQGMSREEFFKNVIGDHNKFMRKRIKLITIDAYMKFEGAARLYDEVEITIRPENPTLTTVDLAFTFLNKTTGRLAGTGRQRIGFTDIRDNVIPLPQEIISGGLDYLDTGAREKVKEIYEKVRAING